MKKSSQKKDNFVTIRVSDEDLTLLNAFCENFGISRSDLIRDAVAQYFFLSLNKDKNPKMILSKKIQKMMFDSLNPSKIEDMAEASFKLGQEDDLVDQVLNKDPKKHNNFENFLYILKSLADNIFPENGQNWCKKVSVQAKNENKVFFAASHDLGQNFSIFLQKLVENYAHFYHFTPYKLDISDSSISLRFKS